MLDPAESTSWYGTDDHADLLEEAIIPYIRSMLGADSLGEKLSKGVVIVGLLCIPSTRRSFSQRCHDTCKG